MDFTKLPPPPPWRIILSDGSPLYINDISGEQTITHPLKDFLLLRTNETNSHKELVFEETIVGRIQDDNEDSDCNNSAHSVAYDFNCEWKEIGLMGRTLSYTMVLSYFLDDKHFEIRFHGVNAVWRYNKLEGIYGPIELIDLFVGNKIVIFDRHLTITSTTLEICNMIDHEAQKLQKHKAYLQSKLDKVGVIPVIRRETPSTTRHITRASSKSGTCNLRKIHIDICKLNEQLVDLGLSHFVTYCHN